MESAPLHVQSERIVKLPTVNNDLDMTLEQAITTRRSGRTFASKPLDIRVLAKLLFLGNGSAPLLRGGFKRTYPNSGNLGAVEIFPIVRDVGEIEPGIYHYDTVHHQLSCLQLGEFHQWLCSNVLFQLEFSQASVLLILTGAIGRLTAKYGVRGYRLALLDVGHVSQNIALMATALGLISCPTAGFIDDELDQALKLDGLETASLLAIAVGVE
jgi:SagB-type dehydrogenase family enzyme